MWAQTPLWAWGLAAAVAACTGKAGGGTASSMGTAGTDAGMTTAAGSSGTGEVCDIPPDDPEMGETATIILRNDTDVVQYVVPEITDCDSELLTLDVDGVGMGLNFTHVPTMACSGDAWCTVGDCFVDPNYVPSIALAPGASYEVTWPGLVWVKASLPSACFDVPICDDLPPVVSCEVATPVSGRPFSVSLSVTSFCDPESTTISPCGCDAPGGVCETSVIVYGPKPEQTISAQGTFPENVELVIAP